MGRIREDVRRLFRLDLHRRDLETRAMDEEIELHIAARAEQLEARGLSAEEASIEARRMFGDMDAARASIGATVARTVTTARWRGYLDALSEDLSYVFRSLRRSPGFAVTVVLSFALGIGATAVMFGIVNRLLLRGPEHIVDARNVRRLHAQSFIDGLGDWPTNFFGYISYAILRDQSRTIERAAGYVWNGPYKLRKPAETDTKDVSVTLASWDFFPLLGVRPALGRFYTADEDRPPNGTPVVVISHGLWTSTFAGDTAILGSSIELKGKPYTIIGVAPEQFTGPDLSAVDAWLPISVNGGDTNWWTTWNINWMGILVRLKPGVSAKVVDDEITALQQRSYAGIAGNPIRNARFFVLPLNLDHGGQEPTEVGVARWLTGVSMAVLLIACANVANLLLARVTRRRREVAVRLALGISRARLTRLLIAESLVLAVAGCLLALVFAYWAGAAIQHLLLPRVWFPDGSITTDVLAFSAGVTALMGVIVGLAPALQARSLDLTHSLKAGTRQSGGYRNAMQAPLLLAQSALSVTLLIGAGLFLRSFERARSVDLGFTPDRFVEAWMNFPEARDTGLAAFRARVERESEVSLRVLERLRVTRGVEHAALAVGSPFGSEYSVTLRVPGRDSIPTLPGGGPFTSSVTWDYFETVGMRLLQGRLFASSDHKGSEPVAIVNETMARTLWAGKTAIGECILVGSDPCSRIVGVVADARRHNLREQPVMQYYLPWGQSGGTFGSVIVVRPTGEPAAFVVTVQRIAREVAGVQVRANVKQDDIDPLAQTWRAGTLLFSIFGGLALVIAAIGLYSVIAYMVAQRTHEFGVRLALGASARQVIGMVLSRGVLVSCLGLAAGTAIALLAGRYLEPLLFETRAHDPLVLGGTACVLIVVAIASCFVPARRAASVDPMIALRAD